MPDEEWIDAKTAADILRVSERQVNRRGNEGSLQTRRVGPRRVLYLRTDVERLASDLQATERPHLNSTPKAEMVPFRDVVGSIERAQAEVAKVREEAGYLRGQLEVQARMLTDMDATKRQLDEANARIRELEYQLAPWWQRLFRRR